MLSFDQHCQAMIPAVALWSRVLVTFEQNACHRKMSVKRLVNNLLLLISDR
jgi:hypothetical protein